MAAAKIVGLLSWYDENPSWLAAYVGAMATFGCSHIIACDGPYLLYPGALEAPRSDIDQVEALTRAAQAVGSGLTLYQPTQPWLGGEVEKRDFMFGLGERMVTSDDWYFLVDADEVVRAPSWDRRELETTDRDVGEVQLFEKFGGLEPSQHPLRRLFRALPDMHIEIAHYILTAEKDDRRVYLSGAAHFDLEPTLYLRDVYLDHHNRHRNPLRYQKGLAYYEMRDAHGIESLDEREVEHAQS